MLISYNWLQAYFPKPLPSPEELAKLFTFHAFEIEALEKKGTDTVLDIKILPDRAHYCLSHRGVAGEAAAILGTPVVEMLKPSEFPKPGKTRPLSIKIEEPKLCRRYIGRVVENVSVGKSSGWLKDLLEAIGQRSINTIVDSANFVMFDLGQPLHAFDADKVKGGITVRLAKGGERIVTLDNKDVALDEKTLVIADEEGPLAIAGIKGGKRAEVTESTTNLILESANFEPANIRKTSSRLNIKTDAQKRYENEITPVLADKAMDEFSVFALVAKTDATVFAEKIDVYPSPVASRKISFDPTLAGKLLGVEISEEKILDILKRLEIGVEKKGTHLELSIPDIRLDLEIPEDIVEEIARLYGYENIVPVALPPLGKNVRINKNFYYHTKIRDILTRLGYCEVYTYAFQDYGDVEVENPLASDKRFMRNDLLTGLRNCLDHNNKYLPLLGLSDVRIFEIGKVFTKGSNEHTSLGIGFSTGTRKKQQEIVNAEFQKISLALSDVFSLLLTAPVGNGAIEINVDENLKNARDPKEISESEVIELVYKKPSAYPFIVRDVALFVSPSVSAESVQKIIAQATGDLVVKGPTLFDRFEKGDKVSLAYRMVFQSYDRTLSDSETNEIMNKVIATLEKEGFEVRK